MYWCALAQRGLAQSLPSKAWPDCVLVLALDHHLQAQRGMQVHHAWLGSYRMMSVMLDHFVGPTTRFDLKKHQALVITPIHV